MKKEETFRNSTELHLLPLGKRLLEKKRRNAMKVSHIDCSNGLDMERCEVEQGPRSPTDDSNQSQRQTFEAE